MRAAPAVRALLHGGGVERMLISGLYAISGAARIGQQPGPHTRRKTSVPLVPPKPKLFFTATSIFISRAVLAQ